MLSRCHATFGISTTTFRNGTTTQKVDDCFKFIVTPGNNSGLIRKAMEKRDWWIEI